MSAITTHVLDTGRGQPAANLIVELEQKREGRWQRINRTTTDADGRVRDLLPPDPREEPAVYRLTFQTGEYFERQGIRALHPEVAIVFRLAAEETHLHLPLLLGPFSYITYRGS